MTAVTHRPSSKTAPSKAVNKRDARMEVRLTTDIQELLKAAAEMTGRSVSDFVLSAATSAAHQAIEKTLMVRLSLADQQRFAEAILAPAEPTDTLVRAFKRRHERMGAV